MKNHYIIGNCLLFDPVKNTLTMSGSHTGKVVLSKPAARCLVLLIERQGEVISHDDFITEVWGKKGVVVTKNTYYQSISLLRKKLKELGFDDNIIVTLPRRGLMLAKESCVVEQQNVVPFAVEPQEVNASGVTIAGRGKLFGEWLSLFNTDIENGKSKRVKRTINLSLITILIVMTVVALLGL